MKNKKDIIAVLHLHEFPHDGNPDALAETKKAALRDLLALQAGGIESLIIENEFEGSLSPYGEFLSDAQKEMMFEVADFLKPHLRVSSLGFCVLLNDYRTAFELAKRFGGSFIRLDTFVDKVERISDGIKISPDPAAITAFRKKLGAEDVEIWADVHVKHTKMLEEKSIGQSALDAAKAGADGIIVTGDWTGQAPSVEDISKVKNAVPDARIILGSGINAGNIATYIESADKFIIGTAFKKDGKFDKGLVEEFLAEYGQSGR